MGGQGGCERRIEVFVKIQKKKLGGRVWGGGGGSDVNEELKFLGKCQKKNWGGGPGGRVGGGQDGCERRIEVFVRGVGLGDGVRVDVNEELNFL